MKKKLTLENISILIVDDVKSMRSILRSLLKNLKIGKSPYMAENGLEGLKLLHTNPIDLAVIDWRMPVMNGAQLLEAIRSDRHLRDLPVLIVTGESERDIVMEAAEIEVEGYLLKPLTPAVLEEKITTIINRINQPDKATLHIKKARELEELGDVTTAIKHMQTAARLKKGASRVLRNLGLLYQKAGDAAAMEQYLLKAASVNPEDAVTRHLLARFYWKNNKLRAAEQYFNETIALTRKFNEDAVAFGEDLLKNQQSLSATTLFSSVVSKSPKETRMLENIINICIEHEELPYARKLLKKLIRDFPSNHDLIYQAATVCEMMDDQDDALAHYLTVDKYQFNRTDVKLKIANIYYQKGKVLQADNYLNMVLKIEPDNEQALELRRLL